MPETWTTHNELAFLKNLGSHSLSQADKDDLLKGYRHSMRHRNDWGDIDRTEIEKVLKEMEGL